MSRQKYEAWQLTLTEQVWNPFGPMFRWEGRLTLPGGDVTLVHGETEEHATLEALEYKAQYLQQEAAGKRAKVVSI